MAIDGEDTTLSKQAREAEELTLEEYYRQLARRVESVLTAPDDERNRKYPRLGRDFLRAAERGVPGTLKVFLDAGMPVSYQDPQTGETALHAAARTQARKAIKLLIASGNCDFLVRDARGRLASELAFLYGRDPALARLLGIKEKKQGRRQGIRVTRRPITAP